MVDSISYDLSKRIVSILGCVLKNIETCIEINNAVGLLDECLENGIHSDENLCAWFQSEKKLIIKTLDDVKSLDAESFENKHTFRFKNVNKSYVLFI